MNIVAQSATKKRTVAAMSGLDELDVGISQNASTRFRKEPDERIVLCAKNERGNGDAIDNAGAGCVVIVVVSVAKSAVSGYDLLVEVADRPNGTNARNSIDLWKERGLAPDAAHETPKKMLLVHAIGRLMKRISAGSEIDGRADGRDGNERWTRS